MPRKPRATSSINASASTPAGSNRAESRVGVVVGGPPHRMTVLRARCCVQPRSRVVPVEDAEKLIDVFVAPVLILQVIRVLEDVEDEDGLDTPDGQLLMVLALQNHELARRRMVADDAPARCFYRNRCGNQLGLELRVRAEISVDCLCKVTL